MKSVIECARERLARLPSAVSGSGGHSATLRAACALVRLGVDGGEALALLSEWNGTHCQPPWTEPELRHKLDSARSKVRSAPWIVPSSKPVRVTWKIERQIRPARPLCDPEPMVRPQCHDRSAKARGDPARARGRARANDTGRALDTARLPTVGCRRRARALW